MSPDEDSYRAGNQGLGGSRLLVVHSGCSGGGKSSLLGELATRGYPTFPEPGRQVVKEELSYGGDGLPWANVGKFIELCISRSLFFYRNARPAGKPAFFDRSLVDAATAYRRAGLQEPPYIASLLATYRYSPRVFLVPPWKELFRPDEERRHHFEEAVREYEALLRDYPALGYAVTIVPRGTVQDRADFIEAALESP